MRREPGEIISAPLKIALECIVVEAEEEEAVGLRRARVDQPVRYREEGFVCVQVDTCSLSLSLSLTLSFSSNFNFLSTSASHSETHLHSKY